MDFLSTNFDSKSGLVSSIINLITSSKFRRQDSSLIFFSGALNSSSPVWLFLSWCQQHYSSAWRTPFGTSAVMAILWNCLRNLSHYMLRAEQGRRWRQTLKIWVIQIDLGTRRQLKLKNTRKNISRLLWNIISVSFRVDCFYLQSTHLTTSFNTARSSETKVTSSWLQKLTAKIRRRQWMWWGRNLLSPWIQPWPWVILLWRLELEWNFEVI